MIIIGYPSLFISISISILLLLLRTLELIDFIICFFNQQKKDKKNWNWINYKSFENYKRILLFVNKLLKYEWKQKAEEEEEKTANFYRDLKYVLTIIMRLLILMHF
jgi:hypothetical protein